MCNNIKTSQRYVWWFAQEWIPIGSYTRDWHYLKGLEVRGDGCGLVGEVCQWGEL